MNHARGYHTCMVMTLPGKKDLIVIVSGGGKYTKNKFLPSS